MPSNTSTETSTKTSTDDLQKDVAALKDDFAAIRDDLKHLAGNAVSQGKSAAIDAKAVAKDKLDESLDSVEAFVKTKPATAVGIAFAAGIVTAMYLGRGK